MKFNVMVPEVWINHITVEASSRRAAIIAALNSEGESVEIEYSHIDNPEMDISNHAPIPRETPGAWFVDEVKEKQDGPE